MRERRAELERHPGRVDEILAAGAATLRPIAQATMEEVRDRMGSTRGRATRGSRRAAAPGARLMTAERREFPPVEEQLEVLRRGVVDFISEDELKRKAGALPRHRDPAVGEGRFRPDRADIHLGHTVLMRKMRQFQDLGHQVVYVIGDFTAAIATLRPLQDPPAADREQILATPRPTPAQAFMTLDAARRHPLQLRVALARSARRG